MCNTFAVYFQIFATFGYKKVKNSDMVDVNKVNLGKAYVKKERQPDGMYAEIHCNRYKIIRRCRYCGYEDCKLTNEKGRPF